MRDYIGSRRTILVASLVICIGMVGASFSRTVAHLILTYGLITGVGMGMALNPIFVSSGYYFVRYRGIASGVVAAGSSTGMFVGGPIIRSLLDSYGLGGTYLIMGAIGLQLAVVGMVMRPSSMELKREEGGRMVLEKNWKMDSIMLASASTLPSVGGLGNVLGASTFNILRDKDAQSETQKSQLLYGIPEDKVVNYHVPEVNVTSGDVTDTHSRLDWHFQSRQRLYSQCSYVSSIENVSTRGRLYSSYILRDIGRPLSRSSLSIRTDDRPPEGATCCQLGYLCLDAFRILKNPAFLLYMFSCFMWYFGEAAVFTYLPSYAISEGTPPIQAALLMTVMGAGSIVSRLITGFVAGDSSVGPELMHIGLLGLCGALTVTLPLYASSTSGQFVYSGLFGLYAGGLVSSINIIIIQLIGVDNIALGFGFISFGLGVGCLAGPVLAGVIVGTTGNYGHVYFFCGTLLLVGCLAGCPIVMFKPRPPDHDTLGYFRKRGSIRSGSQVVSDDGVRSLA
ncbi:hypothetical protein C0Q70_21569 [Pomacea canaliculata]|uniref:Major facilitator superfamily (MFS) profile domain-containing protein n=1 Tax=Pomacea canaliculata TaxID=400727 RepID=A0A2T7NCV7_POMCA|nr:hypothetical protein C0Q70_21569 [Pomacea canaliculata]